jgi:hypothetical protein
MLISIFNLRKLFIVSESDIAVLEKCFSMAGIQISQTNLGSINMNSLLKNLLFFNQL